MKIPSKLLNKYNIPVPRYTSYPPANKFDVDIAKDQYLKLIGDSNKMDPSKISIYIHIPFCKKMCHYCGCNACNIGNGTLVKPYLDAVIKEINIVSSKLDKNRKISQIHFGGGTPNAIEVEYIGQILDTIKDRFEFTANPEVAIECHPAYLNSQYIEKLTSIGFNRFSLGIQDFRSDVLKMINREAPAEPVQKTIEFIRSLNPNAGINLDFIYGLPGQTADSFRETIKKAANLNPDRIVTFSYAHVPWIKRQQKILERYGLPSPEEKMDMFLNAYNSMIKNAYKPIGLDHYVKKDDDLFKAIENKQLHRNFQGYCTRETTGQVYAFGASSISQLAHAYIQNMKDVKTYINQITKEGIASEKGTMVNKNQQTVREIITGIMCNKELNWDDTSTAVGIEKKELINITKINNTDLQKFQSDGLIEFNDDKITITETGSLFIRNIAAAFDPEFKKSNNKYSKSV